MNGCLSVLGLIFLLPFVLVILFIVKLLKKSKDSAWAGKVVEKKVNVVEDFDSGNESNNYVLVIETDKGTKRNIAVAKPLYDSCQVGDRIDKPKGSLIPKKV
ncbi:hypothetical protein COT44_03070 [Candidatus Shapirobacteria bacterium CG08_land_8_20_14_0_20_39_18]|uniref:DUF7489 domain-containing protein n=1 Tax=Candidatus Shapirobacteria bacterium CG08_land_8_20_14_0_20_39_18 TaxID=1974883 RepID=A0A2M6XCL3_9BACT|nr:MAG: hypothetical protein COT44_03070 [Candidatus Shapirobacteria bacterium CG08_land_8_20_14_0_20_39_18]PIY66496.1 MAG: hypothetical protein COY91_00185 [Candidatus Shapirobacteria bacterium CG_4_10_14_0_8_um_filter_39_15]